MFYLRLQLACSTVYLCKQNNGHFLSFISNELLSSMTDDLIQSVLLLKQGAPSSRNITVQ